ncbi:hypothetical protein C8F01DRAFT_1373612 [Mycena amicta]|nr:hypothetical protein C8F01DRAFT_1373612 [Mycena amicta]
MNCGLDIPKRVAVACSNCRERKIKCITESKEKSCMRCHFNGMDCTYLATEKQRERAVVKAKLAKDSTGSGKKRKSLRGSSLVAGLPATTPSTTRPTPYPLTSPTPRISVSRSPRLKMESHDDKILLDLDLDLHLSGPSPRLSSHLHRHRHSHGSAPASVATSPLSVHTYLPSPMSASTSALDLALPFPPPVPLCPPEQAFYLSPATPTHSDPSPTSSTFSGSGSSSSAASASSTSYPTPPPTASFDLSAAYGCYPSPQSAYDAQAQSAFAHDMAAYDLAVANAMGFVYPYQPQLPTPIDSPTIYAPSYDYHAGF